jgi:hypothetical protein
MDERLTKLAAERLTSQVKAHPTTCDPDILLHYVGALVALGDAMYEMYEGLTDHPVIAAVIEHTELLTDGSGYRAEWDKLVGELQKRGIIDEIPPDADIVSVVTSDDDTFEADTRLLGHFGRLYVAAQRLRVYASGHPDAAARTAFYELAQALSLPPDIEAAVEGPRGRQ